MMQLGAEGIFVGSGIFKSKDPKRFANAIVDATTHFDDPPSCSRRAVRLGDRRRCPASTSAQLPEAELMAPRGTNAQRIGVLALQGDVVEHLRGAANAPARGPSPSKRPPTSRASTRLIVPGGESTTVMKLLDRFGLGQPIVERARAGMPLWGTCMGMIVAAHDVAGLAQPTLDLIDITVRRNAFGRQNDSAEVPLAIPALGSKPFPGDLHSRTVDRALRPRRRDCSPSATDTALWCVKATCSPPSFHPELTDDPRIHQYFVGMTGQQGKPSAAA